MKKSKKRIVLKKWVRGVILCSLVFSATCGFALILFGVNYKTSQTPYFSYNGGGLINYKVHLKDNEFYQEDFIDEGNQYTSELIDYIDVDFNYNFNSSKLVEYNYFYDINASIIGEYETSDEGKANLWTKKYVLSDLKKESLNSTEMAIKENLKIKYDTYNEEVVKFKSTYKLSVDSYLDVILNLKYSIKYDGENIDCPIETLRDESDSKLCNENMKIKIPLSHPIISISKNTSDQFTGSLTIETISKNYNFIYVGMFIIVGALILFLVLRDTIFIHKKTDYRKTLDRILKDYAEIIVETTTPINYDGLEILKIKNFDDMVDAEEEVKSPILLYEAVKDCESHFVVVNGNHAYKYVLSVENE